ncbi:MAG: tetratricopeptide repeat protein [Eubacterium sp.]
MSGLMLCNFKSSQPYYIQDINKNIYSIEELSYYLYNYLYLIDESFFSNSLIEYIDEVLEQKVISQGIKQAQKNRASIGELISFVVKASGYYSEKELIKFQKQIELLGSKSSTERTKAKADILMNSRKYNLAMSYYKKILAKGIKNELPKEFYGSIYNNIGVILSKTFNFKDALPYFKSAYNYMPERFVLKEILVADIIIGDKKQLERDMEKYNVDTTFYDETLSDMELARKTVMENKERHVDLKQFFEECKNLYVEEMNSSQDNIIS